MTITWKLKKWLAVEHNIYKPSELQILLAEKAGVQLSLQTVSSLINKTPEALRVQTIQALCNALDCKLSDFCEIEPDKPNKDRRGGNAESKPVRLYGGKQSSQKQEDENELFPDPRKFKNQA